MKEDQEQSGGALVPSSSLALTKNSNGLVRRGLDDLVKLSAASNSSEVDANQRELPKPRFSEAEVARQLKDMAQYLDEVEEQEQRRNLESSKG